MSMWDTDQYIGWTAARLRFLEERIGPAWFAGRFVYDIGAGHGWVGKRLEDWGARVRYFDANAEHVRGLLADGRDGVQMDCDAAMPAPGADALVCFGLLYHLARPRETLATLCTLAPVVIVESEVVDAAGIHVDLRRSEAGYDQSPNGYGVVPSVGAIEHALRSTNCAWVRCDDPILTSPKGTYDWAARDDGSYSQYRRRLWVAWRYGQPSPLRTEGAA